MKSKVKITYVVSSLKKCGPTNQLYGIINNLDRNTFDVTILTIFNEEKDTDIKKFILNSIKVDSLRLKKKTNVFLIVKELRRYFKRQESNIIHSTGLIADFCSCFIPKVIHISTIRNYAYYDYISAYGKKVGNIMVLLNKWAIENTQYPICCSKSIMLMYEKKIKTKLYYIQNGVDTTVYKVTPSHNKLSLRKKLNLPLDKKIIIVSGSLTERKDPLFIINSFEAMGVDDKACLLLIGDGELHEECKQKESESILVKGSVSNVDWYLQASDIYVSASKSEGLPNSVLEAAACGLDIVLSEIPQHSEIFEKNKELAEFFKLKSIKQFTNLLYTVIKEENNENQKERRSSFIEDNFSAKANSKKYSDFYLRTISFSGVGNGKEK